MRIAAVSLAAAFLMSSCAAGAPVSAVVDVRIVARPDDAEHPFAFEPATVTVPAGATVRWVNTTETFHTVTSTERADAPLPSGLFDFVLASRDARAERRFDEAGTFAYYCQPHSEFMRATVVVEQR